MVCVGVFWYFVVGDCLLVVVVVLRYVGFVFVGYVYVIVVVWFRYLVVWSDWFWFVGWDYFVVRLGVVGICECFCVSCCVVFYGSYENWFVGYFNFVIVGW